MPTLQDLIAQQAALNAQIAEHERPLVQEAKDLLTGDAVTALAGDLTAIRDQLPESQAKVHIGNVLTVLSAVPQVLAQELARLNPGPVYGGSVMPPIVMPLNN
jgi:predicted lysophospholipase L1 biosynthesis ABC-type transport system permease subunit